MPTLLTAKNFCGKLNALASAEEAQKRARYFQTGEGGYGAGDQFIGVRMGDLAQVAKSFAGMPLDELEKLLESPIHEHRVGAIHIIDKAARKKTLPDATRKAYFDLYVRRHDRINNWDLVDTGASHMVGLYLIDKPRDILYRWAASENIWERRSAIIGTAHLIRQNDLDDTFRIAGLLLQDKHDLIHKAVGWMLREAGEKDRSRLNRFLDTNAATMPRTMLRYAIEKFAAPDRQYYLKRKTDTK